MLWLGLLSWRDVQLCSRQRGQCRGGGNFSRGDQRSRGERGDCWSGWECLETMRKKAAERVGCSPHSEGQQQLLRLRYHRPEPRWLQWDWGADLNCEEDEVPLPGPGPGSAPSPPLPHSPGLPHCSLPPGEAWGVRGGAGLPLCGGERRGLAVC